MRNKSSTKSQQQQKQNKGDGIMLVLSEQEIMKNYLMKDAITDLKKGMKAKREQLIHNPGRTVLNLHEFKGLRCICQVLFYKRTSYRYSESPYFMKILK